MNEWRNKGIICMIGFKNVKVQEWASKWENELKLPWRKTLYERKIITGWIYKWMYERRKELIDGKLLSWLDGCIEYSINEGYNERRKIVKWVNEYKNVCKGGKMKENSLRTQWIY